MFSDVIQRCKEHIKKFQLSSTSFRRYSGLKIFLLYKKPKKRYFLNKNEVIFSFNPFQWVIFWILKPLGYQ